MGPTLIFDKSFLQSLNANELFELDAWFELACPPVLISEIIADLRTKRKDRVPIELVRALAAKMQSAYGPEPPAPVSLVRGEFRGYPVPMRGSIPVMPGSRGVRASKDGKMLMIDMKPQQEMWRLWANGDFTAEEIERAEKWRAEISAVTFGELRTTWAPFVQDLGNPSTLEEILNGIDAYLGSSENQPAVLNFTASFFDVNVLERVIAQTAFDLVAKQTGRLPLMRDAFPYSVSAIRVFMAYACMVARGLHTPRQTQTDHIDLQYLFYAPFCMTFASSDALHREMFAATTTIASFAWGYDLKMDLARLANIRSQMSREDWRAHRMAHGIHPPPSEESLVSRLWSRHMGPPRPYDPDAGPKTVEEMGPDFLAMLNRVRDEFGT
jgi:hypothetical protein